MRVVYLLDNNLALITQVAEHLINQDFEVECFNKGYELLARVLVRQPDCVICNVDLKDISGYEICSILRKKYLEQIIILVKNEFTLKDKLKAYSVNCDDFLTDEYNVKELSALLNLRLKRREDFSSQEIKYATYEIGKVILNLANRSVTIDESEILLTNKELALLITLMSVYPMPSSRKILFKAIWQYDFEGDSRYLDDLVKRLRNKIKKIDDNLVIKTVYGYGYKLDIDDKLMVKENV